jgi:hypothetical protein
LLFAVLPDKRSLTFACLTVGLIGLLSGCANSSMSEALERSLAADPKLEEGANILGNASEETPRDQSQARLPEDFPEEIPLYPEAELEAVESLSEPDTEGQRTTWMSSDPMNAIQRFYQEAFESGEWEIVSQPEEEAGGILVARQDNLQVTVSIPSTAATDSADETATPRAGADFTEFDIQYSRNPDAIAASPTDEDVTSEDATEVESTPTRQTSSSSSKRLTDLDQAPQDLRPYIKDLAALGVFSRNTAKSNDGAASSQFDPNETISRRELARWLVAANNLLYANRPGQQIRLASESAQPAFEDVPRSDADFQSIQALAEAGLVPSPLTGDSTEVLFRPDAPLTREDLILWKVPLDMRQALPTASIEAVKETWGFQDATKIDPKALRAVLADYQNGEQANLRRMLGYTTLFQPNKPVTRAEAAAALWYFGYQGEGISAEEALQTKRQSRQSSATSASESNN